ncbi:MAG: ribosome silencing factor [Bryobacterales bacterium]|nr:ribosome silencing factor [Bryobacterales bacterium]
MLIPPLKKARKTATAKTAAKTATKKRAAPKTAAAAKTAPRKKATASAAAAAPGSNAWQICVRAAGDKKATAVRALDLRESQSSFADFRVICSGGNPRQTQAIADEVERLMKAAGDPPISVEGYNNGEWILVDFGDLVVNVFTESARSYYDLDRLYRDARLLTGKQAEAASGDGNE